MNTPHHIKDFITILIMALMCAMLLPSAALCRLSGDAELGYVNYESHSNTRSVSAHSFTQHYSLLYDTHGKFSGGRLGSYDVSLGYEWLAYDSDVSSTSLPEKNDSRGHINFQGDVLLNPKELPLKLRLYSRDLKKSNFSTFTTDLGGGGSQSGIAGYTPMFSGISNGIDNGIHVESGALLVMGVKNGMTNGYNEVLRHFPMLMLDFKDQIEKDRNRVSPVDTHLSRLAFVSLNKKDNWFHYRYTTFEDKVDKRNNYNETQLQLGTVDHTLQRRWVDFSNWLSVSADGQLTKRMNVQAVENYEEFRLNIFGAARRKNWELRTFNSFTRYNEINKDMITYTTSLPTYASGIISPTAGWSAYSKYSENRTNAGDSFKSITGGYAIDAYRKSPFTLNQRFGVEHVTISNGNSDSLILNGSIATTSTPLFSRALSLKAKYDINNYLTDSNVSSSSLINQGIVGVVAYDISNQLRIGASQSNRFASGSKQNISSTIHGSEISSPQYETSSIGDGGSGESSYQSLSTLTLDWIPAPRLLVAMGASQEISTNVAGERRALSVATAKLSYAGSRLKIISTFSYASGSGSDDELSNNFRGTAGASFIFSRNLDAKIDFSYFKILGGNASAGTMSAAQSLNYRFNRNSGMGGRLFEINESFSHSEEYTENYKNIRRTNTLLFGVKYFPLRQLMVAGGATYYFENNVESSILTYYGSLSMGFRLLSASVDYTYGKNKIDNRVDKRFTANLKKRF